MFRQRAALFFMGAIALGSLVAQAAEPYAEILRRESKIMPAESDDKETRLLKEGYNAAHAEIRVKYNYWLQGIGDADGLIDAIARFEAIRPEVEADVNRGECARQKLAFARELEKRCPETRSQTKYQALCEIDEAALRSFRLAAELEYHRLSMGADEPDEPRAGE